MNAPAHDHDHQTFSYLDHDAIDPSATNPRKTLGDITELTESVKTKGIIEPLIVRKHAKKPGRFELVCGWRRWSAAGAAGLEQVPAILRELDDDTALDLQLAENIDRADLTPFEEASAFSLRIDRGQTVQHIADRIGRPPSYIAQRLKLLALSPLVRKELDAGHITLGVALVLARLPNPELQTEALGEVGGSEYDRCMAASEAAKLIEEKFLLRLDKSGFSTTDATLVPKAGACSECPKRTGQQRELFPDAARDDLCLDPKCFRGKLDAVFKLRVKDAKKAGQDVLDPKAFAKATSYSGTHRKLDDTEYIGNKSRTLKALFGKDLPPLTLAQDPETGRVVELVARADVERALRAAKKETGKGSGRGDGHDDYAAQRKRDEQKAKLRRKAISRIAEIAVEKGDEVAIEDVLGLVVRVFAARVWNETQRRVLERRGYELKGKHAEDEILKLAQSLEPGGELEGLGLELVVYSCAPQVTHGGSDGTKKTWDDLCRVLGVDLKAIEKEIAAEKKAGKQAPKAAPKAKTKPKPKPVPGVTHFLSKGANACGAPPSTSVGSGGTTSRDGVSCQACNELLLDRMAKKAAKPKKAKKSTPGVCRGCGCTDDEACDGGCEWVEPDLCSSCAGEQPKGRAKRKAKKPSKSRGAVVGF